MLTIIAAALALQTPPARDTVPAAQAPPGERTVSTAYADPFARELVRRAREYRRYTDRSVTAYRALGRERQSAQLRTRWRERLLGGSELAARIDWHRDGPVKVQVLGAHERDVDGEGFGDPRSSAASLAFDPADDRMRTSLLGTTWIRHPLAEGSERDYRFRSGDTLVVRLSTGETVRAYELRVEPRRLDAPLVSGSIWVEDRSYGVVRTLLRLSQSLRDQIHREVTHDSAGRRQINVSAGISRDSTPKRGGSRLALLPDVRIDVRYITTEYALVQRRWWMPASAAIDATVSAGSFGSIPVRFERSWTQYEVEGDTTGAAAHAPAVAESAPVDTPQACRGKVECQCRAGTCRLVEVEIPADTAALMASAELPPPLTPGAPLLTGKEGDEIAKEVSQVAATPWIFGAPSITRAPLLLRYNRVEGVSLGARMTADFGPLAADATLRIATATGEPDVELGVRRDGPERRLRLAAYRRLAVADATTRALGLGNSLSALLWGRDNGDYFRATGVELLGAPPRSERPSMEWRLFAEHQHPVDVASDFTFRGIASDFDFRPSMLADRADQAGAALTLRPVMDARLLGMSWGVDLTGEAQAGTFRFARPSAAVHTAIPLFGGFDAALEGAAGTSFGEVPVQGLWRLGGPGSLRGYDGGTAAGTAFWRGRAEIAAGAGTLRPAVFTDLGWAGARDAWTFDQPLWSVGAGVSLLNGLFRADLARALRAPTGWRVELYLDTAL